MRCLPAMGYPPPALFSPPLTLIHSPHPPHSWPPCWRRRGGPTGPCRSRRGAWCACWRRSTRMSWWAASSRRRPWGPGRRSGSRTPWWTLCPRTRAPRPSWCRAWSAPSPSCSGPTTTATRSFSCASRSAGTPTRRGPLARTRAASARCVRAWRASLRGVAWLWRMDGRMNASWLI